MPQLTKVRVHDLAKELGVTSKAILAKCGEEGLSIANHMSVLTAGLEATIREWFSEGPHVTAVESSAPVELEKVRRPRRKKAEAAVPAPVEAAPSEPVAAEVDPAKPPVEEINAAEVAAPPVAAEALAIVPEAPTPSEAPSTLVLVEPARILPTAAVTAAPIRPAATTTAPPATAAAQAPAGPQNIPRPATLQGPRVVRMDRPDNLPAPRSAARSTDGGVFPPPLAGGKKKAGAKGRGGDEEEDERPAAKKVSAKVRANPRRSGRDSLAVVGEQLREWRDRDLLERKEKLDQAVGRSHRAIEPTKREKGAAPRQAEKPLRVEMTEPIMTKEFCNATGISFNQIAPKLMAQGMLAGMNKSLENETAQLLALEFGLELVVNKALTSLEKLREERARMERPNLAARPPIVTILGHVDHGKTSLLDHIRKTNVAAGEAGGITQHIGAYQVNVGEKSVTFLDTPGHAAFTAMRARGANLTDVVVLVVAADDGVMPQTIEAINHAKAAKVPIVVALNKMDLPGVDLNKIYGQLSGEGLTPQAWGGETDVIHTSALTGTGIDELLTHLAAMSDLMDLKADPMVPVSGTVIEAEMKEGAGPVARVMVREGTLRPGTFVVAGAGYGKVRALTDDRGRRLSKAGPGMPVEVAGLNTLPAAGDELYEVDSSQEAGEIAEEMQRSRRLADLTQVSRPMDLASLMTTATTEAVPELNVILKADMQGSVDVLRKTLSDIPADQVKLTVLHAGAGAVTEGDVLLAAASRAIIIAFTVVAEPAAQRAASDNGVEIRPYRVIYEVEGDIRKAMAGLLAPSERIESRGRAEVREVFNIGRVGRVAGCIVREGSIARKHLVRVLRDSVPVKERAGLASLRRFKEDVSEVRSGLECGLRIEGFDDVKPGDVIESYAVIKEARTI